jgi:ubiquinone/menaquinone biosynthesis C-methylase UbiE
MDKSYVHGYSGEEATRLNDQASTLEALLHHDTVFPAGSRILEAGCGTGAQTEILARRNPEALFTAVDLSGTSLASASRRIKARAIDTVQFEQADCADLPYGDNHFDHVFVCFMLEHLADPEAVLGELGRVLKPGGTLTAIEGDHGSFYCYPETAAARQTVRCLIELQAASGGDALIGRRLYPLLYKAGFTDVRVSPRVVYVDASRPEWEQGFSRDTFIAMVEGVAKNAIEKKMISSTAWRQGIDDLKATIGRGTFHYTFFKAFGHKPVRGTGAS